jgi:hypothetical protein
LSVLVNTHTFYTRRYYIEKILDAGGKGDSVPTGALGVLRVIRVLRIFKLTRNNQTIRDFFTAMYAAPFTLWVWVWVRVRVRMWVWVWV